MTFDRKNATADEIAAYEAGKNEALETETGVPRTMADVHALTREQVITHRETVKKIMREQAPMSRREARRINSEQT